MVIFAATIGRMGECSSTLAGMAKTVVAEWPNDTGTQLPKNHKRVCHNGQPNDKRNNHRV